MSLQLRNLFICLSLQSQKVTHKINNRHLLIHTWKLGSLNFRHITSSILFVILKILIPCGVYDTRSEFQTWLEMVFQICLMYVKINVMKPKK